MATPIPSQFDLTYDRVVDGMTTGYYWALAADRTIDWSISDGFAGEHWNNPALLQSQISGMLGTFSYYANVRFNYAGYYATPSYAYQSGSEINVSLDANYFFGGSGSWARGFFPRPSAIMYHGDAGDVYLNINSQFNWLPSYEVGSAGWMVFLHELGHAVGLKHPHDDGGNYRPTLQQVGLASWNIDFTTIMSYEDNFNWNLLQWDPATPMILDVLALQYLYGKNMTTNAGDTLHALSRSDYYMTLWDASGTDWVSAETQQEGWFIMLPNTSLSSLVDTKAGFAMPLSDFSYSAPRSLVWLAGDYENAVGSNFADGISGTDAANFLSGNGGDDFISGLKGNDVIDGGAGLDTAIISGLRAQSLVSKSPTQLTVTGPDGTDAMTNVERLQFDNIGLAFDLDGSAGMTAKLLGAVFGAVAVQNRSFVGIGLSYFDGGWTYGQVANLALDAALGGTRSNASVFDLLYLNTVGARAPQALADYWVGQLQSGTMSQPQLATFAADMQINLDNINFVGLTAYGIEYQL